MSTLIPDEQRQAVLLDGESLEDGYKFKYLGSMFVANGQGTEEIRSRINLARSAFSRPLYFYFTSILSLVAALNIAVHKGQGLPGSKALDVALNLPDMAC